MFQTTNQLVISSSKKQVSSPQLRTIGDFIDMHHRTFLPGTLFQNTADG